MALFNINGNVQYSGKNIVIENDKIYIDGNLIKGSENDKVINIYVEGNVEGIDVTYCQNLIVDGDVGQIDCTSGTVKANTVKGKVKTTSGKVEITGNCEGDVETLSGAVKANNVAGKVKTMSGSINVSNMKGDLNL